LADVFVSYSRQDRDRVAPIVAAEPGHSRAIGLGVGVLVTLGEREQALDLLEGVADRSSPGMLTWIEADSDLDPSRADPRFEVMIARAKARHAAADTQGVAQPGA